MTDFVPLTQALEDWFDKPLAELPEACQKRVREEFFPMQWDELISEQRRSVACQCDYLNDPIAHSEFDAAWEWAGKRQALVKSKEAWQSTPATTTGELALKEARLKELEDQLARLERAERGASAYRPRDLVSDTPTDRGPYIGYIKALTRLRERLNATPEELAAWILVGSDSGGIAAYLNANELDSPAEFCFQYYHHRDYDSMAGYLKLIMNCWFLEKDVEDFIPTKRFISGKALIERWSNALGGSAKDYIEVVIKQSRLADMHPTCGETQGSNPGNHRYPPLEAALFFLSEVEVIEDAEFGVVNAADPSLTQGSNTLASAEHVRTNGGAGAEVDAQPPRQAKRDTAIRAKFAELAGLGNRNYVKEIRRSVPGADSLSDRRIRDIAKGR